MGIKIIQKLISESAKFLKEDGWVAFEIGLGQGDFVLKFMERGVVERFVVGGEEKNGWRVKGERREKRNEG